MNVLIAQMSPAAGEALRVALEAQGHRVLVAADEAQARALLERDTFDAIVSDAVAAQKPGSSFCFGTSSVDIDELKRAEETARANEARFRELAEAMPHLVWQLSPDGTTLYTNQRWRNYTGRESITGHEWAKLVHPEDLVAAWERWPSRVNGTDSEALDEVRLRRYDGSYRWFANRTVPVRDQEGRVLHLVGTSTDIDDLKRAEQALRESRQQLELAIAASKIGIWEWNLKTNRVKLSREWKRQLGYDEHEIGEQYDDWQTRVHPDDLPRTLAKVHAYIESSRPEYQNELRIRHKDGSYRWMLTHATLQRDSEGKPERMLGCDIDVTEQKRLEEELRQSQKMEAVGRLAGGVAHDFNNLLTVVLGHASLIEKRKDLAPEVANGVKEIGLAAERAASVTSQLLAFGRRQKLQSRNLDLNAAVADVIAMLQRVLGEDVTIVYEPARQPTHVQADPNQLAQVLLNLAVNARDAMPRGGQLRIRTTREPLDERIARTLAPDQLGEFVCLMVSDTGCGIPPAILPRIFEPFFTTKDIGKGTGLGLATVYGIVRQHSGWVTVDSDRHGTRFNIYLPLVAHDDKAVAPQVRELPRDGGCESILLVEDDPAVCSVMQSILSEHGYLVATARTAAEALGLWRERGDEVDLVLTDVVMPEGMTGYELADRLLALKPTLKLILSSGYSSDGLGSATGSSRAVRFLQKPYTADQLLRTVREVLDAS